METPAEPARPPLEPASAVGSPARTLDPRREVERIVVGSCLDQARPHPIVSDIVLQRPDVVVMLGDNVYADAWTSGDLVQAYRSLGESPGYRALAEAVPILAVWDDHDYGRNDMGAEFELKEFSKTVMLDFFGEPPRSARRTREGNYDARTVGPPGRRVQFLLLDTRWFRGPLRADPGRSGHYLPHPADATPPLLGEAQWTWLEAQLRVPADLRLLITSIQLVVVGHGFESWGLFPAERRRFLDLVGETGAGGVVLVSGDRHRGELSCAYDDAVGYPLLELTASSLNRPSPHAEDNRFRRPNTVLVGDENFGMLEVDWGGRSVRLTIRGRGGAKRVAETVKLADLQPGSGETAPGCEAIVAQTASESLKSRPAGRASRSG